MRDILYVVGGRNNGRSIGVDDGIIMCAEAASDITLPTMGNMEGPGEGVGGDGTIFSRGGSLLQMDSSSSLEECDEAGLVFTMLHRDSSSCLTTVLPDAPGVAVSGLSVCAISTRMDAVSISVSSRGLAPPPPFSVPDRSI